MARGDPVIQAVQTSLVGALQIAALLLIPAALLHGGVWLWPRGLALVAGVGTVTLAGNLALARWRPDHFRVRQQSVVAPKDRRQPWLDAAGAVALLVIAAVWMGSMPFDVFRLRLLPAPPTWVETLGGLAVLAGTALTPLAVWENRFATPNVQDQTDDGQRVIDTGVYRWVRHPLYLGNLLLAGGAALWLGSTAGLWGAAVLLVFTAGRIAIEERDLKARLPAYAAYARRVRGRLIPFVV